VIWLRGPRGGLRTPVFNQEKKKTGLAETFKGKEIHQKKRPRLNMEGAEYLPP